MDYVGGFIKVLEAGIGLTVAIFVGGIFLVSIDSSHIAFIKTGLGYFADLFGVSVGFLASLLGGLFVVFMARWIISWISNNGGQSANK